MDHSRQIAAPATRVPCPLHLQGRPNLARNESTRRAITQNGPAQADLHGPCAARRLCERFFAFCSAFSHIGGVTPSRPTRHARPCRVPSAFFVAGVESFLPPLATGSSPPPVSE